VAARPHKTSEKVRLREFLRTGNGGKVLNSGTSGIPGIKLNDKGNLDPGVGVMEECVLSTIRLGTGMDQLLA